MEDAFETLVGDKNVLFCAEENIITYLLITSSIWHEDILVFVSASALTYIFDRIMSGL